MRPLEIVDKIDLAGDQKVIRYRDIYEITAFTYSGGPPVRDFSTVVPDVNLLWHCVYVRTRDRRGEFTTTEWRWDSRHDYYSENRADQTLDTAIEKGKEWCDWKESEPLGNY